jgi:hypothetical protein
MDLKSKMATLLEGLSALIGQAIEQGDDESVLFCIESFSALSENADRHLSKIHGKSYEAHQN